MIFKNIIDRNDVLKYGDLTGSTYEDDISIYDKGLESLEGFPKIVMGSVNIGDNKLTTLQYAPEKVTGTFDCSNNKLTSLEHCPKEIGGTLFCEGNKKIKNQVEQIIKYGIMAQRYSTDEAGIQSREQLENYYNNMKRKEVITSKGFRTLLGLNK